MKSLQERFEENSQLTENYCLKMLRDEIENTRNQIITTRGNLIMSMTEMLEGIKTTLDKYSDTIHQDILECISVDESEIDLFDRKFAKMETDVDSLIRSFTSINKILDESNEMDKVVNTRIRKMLSDAARSRQYPLLIDSMTVDDFIKDSIKRCESLIDLIRANGDGFTIDVVGIKPDAMLVLEYFIETLLRIRCHVNPFIRDMSFVIDTNLRLEIDAFEE